MNKKKKGIEILIDLSEQSNQKCQRGLIKIMVTYRLIVTRSGKIIKENRKDNKIIHQIIVSKLTIVLVQQFTIRIDD